ncbi:MAG: hypothetical protein H7308_18875 [Chthonomonadaceae bacterium]|nr:hypothetical protein [Chthonomonadaceae bacterium]
MVSERLAIKLAELKQRLAHEKLTADLQSNPAFEFIGFVEDNEAFERAITLCKMAYRYDAKPDFIFRAFRPSEPYTKWLTLHLKPFCVGQEVLLWFSGVDLSSLIRIKLLLPDWFDYLCDRGDLHFVVLSPDWRTGYVLIEDEHQCELFILDPLLKN